jgi:hypothetical protein
VPGPDGNAELIVLTPARYAALASTLASNPAPAPQMITRRPTRKERKMRAAERKYREQSQIKLEKEHRRRVAGMIAAQREANRTRFTGNEFRIPYK